ncbi:serine/threonine-protein kinase ATR isoform X2 [Arachis hypogaea]
MLPAVDNDCPWKAKCLSLQVLSKLGPNLSSSVVLEVLDMGLHDEAEKVRTEAVISMPVMHFWSTLDISSPVIQKIEYIKRDNEKVKKLVLITLGLLSCLYGCRGATSGLHTDECLYGEIIVVFSNHVGDYFGVWFLLSILVPRMISKRTIDGAAIQCDTSLMIVTKNGDLKIAFVEV